MSSRSKQLRGRVAAVALAAAGLMLAWLCFRVTAVGVLPPGSPLLLNIAPDHPELVLSHYMATAVLPDQTLDERAVTAIRGAAARVPLDDRPYYLLGRQAPPEQVVTLLEAGQRLNPRRRLTHAYLLDRYARAGNYEKAAEQLSILSRLVGKARAPIANALVLMSSNAETLPVVRRVLQTDRSLERLVLVTLAQSDAPPALVLDLAGPEAVGSASAADSWGSALVQRLVANERFGEARAIWERIYNLEDESRALIFNQSFADSAASPPFNWKLAAGSLGAANPDKGGLAVDYYGRESGDLASQTLLLEPGTYRFSFQTEGGAADSESRLLWQLSCTPSSSGPLMNVEVPAAAAPRRVASTFTVPAGCPAQVLRLRGEAGEFPDEVTAVIRDLTLNAGNSVNR